MVSVTEMEFLLETYGNKTYVTKIFKVTLTHLMLAQQIIRKFSLYIKNFYILTIELSCTSSFGIFKLNTKWRNFLRWKRDWKKKEILSIMYSGSTIHIVLCFIDTPFLERNRHQLMVIHCCNLNLQWVSPVQFFSDKYVQCAQILPVLTGSVLIGTCIKIIQIAEI